MAVTRGLFVRKDSTRGTTPVEARVALAGLLTPSGDLGVTPGVISGGGVTGKTSWAYTVAAGHFVTTRSATDGAVLLATDGATDTPTVSAAPATGSRWDLIWIRHRDIENADSDSEAVLGVTSGTASGTPSKPYGSVPAGALVLAEAQVSAGAANTADPLVTITPVAARVAARGGIIPATAAQQAALTASASAANPILTDVGGEIARDAGSGPVPIARTGSLPGRWVLRNSLTGAAAPTYATPLIEAFPVEAATNASGYYDITFPTAFAAAPIVQATTVNGTGVAAVIASNTVSATGCRLFWPGVVGVQVRAHVLAIGWAA